MSLNFITEAKKVTKALAAVGTAVVVWAMSEQGQTVIGGIVHAYPKASAITGVIGFLAVLLHSPKA